MYEMVKFSILYVYFLPQFFKGVRKTALKSWKVTIIMLFALAVHSPIPSLVLHHISVDSD